MTLRTVFVKETQGFPAENWDGDATQTVVPVASTRPNDSPAAAIRALRDVWKEFFVTATDPLYAAFDEATAQTRAIYHRLLTAPEDSSKYAELEQAHAVAGEHSLALYTPIEAWVRWARDVDAQLDALNAALARRVKDQAAAERRQRREAQQQQMAKAAETAQARETQRRIDDQRQAEIEGLNRKRRTVEQQRAAKVELARQAAERTADRECRRALRQQQFLKPKEQFQTRAEKRAARQRQRRERDIARSYMVFENGPQRSR